MSIGQELLNVPMGKMIREMAFAIADAQYALDQGAIETAEMMGGLKTIIDDNGDTAFEDSRVFFGAEYMTVAEALATQVSGGENDPVKKMLEQTFASTQPELKEFDTQNPTVILPGPDSYNYGYDFSGGAPDITTAKISSYEDYENYINVLKNALDDTNVEEGHKDYIRDTIKDHREKNADLFNKLLRVPTRVSMLELGFAPVFYSFVDTIIEVKISISISRSSSSTVNRKSKGASFGWGWNRGPRASVSTSQVNATYSSKYSYTAEGSSLLRTKLAPIPTPPLLEERIRALMDVERQRQEARIANRSDPLAAQTQPEAE